MNTGIWQTVDHLFRDNAINSAVAMLERRLADQQCNRLETLIGHEFSNTPVSVLVFINEFIAKCANQFDVKAVYLEMNGFDINYDRWYFDSFAYDQYGRDPDDLEWLCDWQSPTWTELTLTGLENVQADFEWYHKSWIYKKDRSYEPAYELATLLVMAKFVVLIQKALGSGPLSMQIPVLATAHDFDIVGRFELRNVILVERDEA